MILVELIENNLHSVVDELERWRGIMEIIRPPGVSELLRWLE